LGDGFFCCDVGECALVRTNPNLPLSVKGLGAANLTCAPMAPNDDPRVPSELEIIFDSVWDVIRPRGTLGPKAETQLRLALARRLVILAGSGS
jgi:hypothetical protein